MGDLLFNFLSVPPTWNLCLNKDCTHKDTSMHYFAGQHLPANKMTDFAIYPNVLQNGKYCFYIETRVIRAAWGFHKLFLNATPYPACRLVRPCSGTRPKTPTACSRVTATCLPTPRTRTSSTITPTISAALLISPTPRPTSPSSTSTYPMANCSWTNIPPPRRCRTRSTARNSMRKRGCTIMAQDI